MTFYKCLELTSIPGGKLWDIMTIMSDRVTILISMAISILQTYKPYMNAELRVLQKMAVVNSHQVTLKSRLSCPTLEIISKQFSMAHWAFKHHNTSLKALETISWKLLTSNINLLQYWLALCQGRDTSTTRAQTSIKSNATCSRKWIKLTKHWDFIMCFPFLFS